MGCLRGYVPNFALQNKLNADAIAELTTKHGVEILRTSEDILKEVIETWDEIATAESAKNPVLKKV